MQWLRRVGIDIHVEEKVDVQIDQREHDHYVGQGSEQKGSKIEEIRSESCGPEMAVVAQEGEIKAFLRCLHPFDHKITLPHAS